MDRDAHEVTVAELEAKIDELAIEHLWVDGNPVFTEVARKLDGTEEGREYGPLLLKSLAKILELRMVDPVGCDLLCLKTRYPDMSQHELAMAMTGLGHGNFANRARTCEALKHLRERFPDLAAHMTFSRRGGDQHKRLRNNAELVTEYERLMAEEQTKPIAERRPAKREGSICQELAETYKITGRDGKPSWAAVELRIFRETKKVAERVLPSGYTVAKHAQGSLRARTSQKTQGLTASQASELEELGLPADRSMTLQEFAKALQIALPAVRRLVAAGILPAVRVTPRNFRITPQAALAFLQDRVTLKP